MTPIFAHSTRRPITTALPAITPRTATYNPPPSYMGNAPTLPGQPAAMGVQTSQPANAITDRNNYALPATSFGLPGDSDAQRISREMSDAHAEYLRATAPGVISPLNPGTRQQVVTPGVGGVGTLYAAPTLPRYLSPAAPSGAPSVTDVLSGKTPLQGGQWAYRPDGTMYWKTS